MPRFAAETTVPVERSKAEIEASLIRWGADEFQTGWKESKGGSDGAAMIAFRLEGLFIRFVLPIPRRDEKRFTHKKDRYGYEKKLNDNQAFKEWDQEVRSRWRNLLLAIKGKLGAVECGISTIEKEFLAFIVLPNQLTVGEWMVESLAQIKAGEMPKLLGFAKDNIQDAEFEETRNG
jgi:hypothetical protein